MSLPALFDRLRLPVIGSPLFIISGPELVIAQCKAGIVGSFPALNARPQALLDEWLHRITEELAAHNRDHPDRPAAPFAVNQIVHKSNDRLEADLATCAKWQVPIVITSLGAREELNTAVHGWGGITLHDIIDDRFARKAIEKGAVDILQPDVTRAGGFGCVRRVVDHARQAGIECVLHCYHTGITKAVSLHLTAACRNLDWLEYCVEDNPIQTTVTNEAFPVVDGEVAIPTAPGLGVTLNEDTIATYRRPHPGPRDAAPAEHAR